MQTKRMLRAFMPMLLLVAGTVQNYAAPITPEEAAREANLFAGKRAGVFGQKKTASSGFLPTPVYTATGVEGNCFYVFNKEGGNGFIIVTADDRLSPVLGFSNNGAFDYDRIPDNMKWWLSEYQTDITEYLKRNTDEPISKVRGVVRKARLTSTNTEKTPIEPLVQTKWDQTAPFNNDCPVDSRTGERSVTGCVATAMAQVMKYHEWPVHPKGSNGGYIFDKTTLVWDNMLNEYVSNNWTPQQAKAVAILMRQCGAAVDMMYSSYASGAYSENVPEALYKYFDYSPSIRMEYRDYYSQSAWNNIVYEELAAGRPLYYSGSSPAGGHAFVCDGYLSDEFFHFNWGWGGYEDGYFRLNSLDPSTGGTGSFGGGFNTSQMILLGVKKAEGETKRQRLLLSSGNFEYTKDNTFAVKGAEQNLIYNPLAYSQTFNAGVRVVPFDGGDARYFKAGGAKTTLPSMYGFTEYQVSISGLGNGKYKVYPVALTDEDEWIDIMVPYGMQTYVTLDVNGGKLNFSNDGPGDETHYDIIPANPESVYPIYEGDALAFNMTLTNVGSGDYYKYMILGLYNEDPFGSKAEMSYLTSVPGMSSTDVKFTSETGLEAGEYDMYFFDANYNELREPIRVGVQKRDWAIPSPQGKFMATSVMPNFLTANSISGVTITIENHEDGNVRSGLQVVLYAADGMKEVMRLKSQSTIMFPKEQSVQQSFAPRVMNLAPGYYYWICYDLEGKQLSVPQPLKVTGTDFEAEGGIYRVVDEARKNVQLVGVYQDEAVEDYLIPSVVEGYTVRYIRPDVFSFNGFAKSVSLPGNIVAIPSGEFYCANNLKSLTIRGKNPPVVYEKAFNPEREGEIVVSAAEGGYTNLFKESDDWKSFDMSCWEFETGSGVEITGGLLENGSGEIFNPYYVGADERVRFDVKVPENHVVLVETDVDGKKISAYCGERVSLPALNGGRGKVRLTDVAITDDVDGIYADLVVDVYSIDGRIVARGADRKMIGKLGKGLYIVAGKKIVIK